MERLKLIDDIRMRALSLMKEDSTLSYEDASKEANIQLTGENTLVTKYHQGVELKETFLEIAKKELSPNIRVELYQEEQLKEMIVASRLGVDLESFVNIFLTPDQIRFITLASLNGEDITKYAMDLHFDPEKEMEKLTQGEKGYQKIYSNGTVAA